MKNRSKLSVDPAQRGRRRQEASTCAIGAAMKEQRHWPSRPHHEDNRQQRASTVLTDVVCDLRAVRALTSAGSDDNEGRHLGYLQSAVARKGQCFHQPCLGTREFPARFELIEPDADLPQPSTRRAILASCSTTSITPAT